MSSKTISFTAANTFPAKLLVNKKWSKGGKIRPVHLQFLPTNVCPLNCSFCSCKDKDKRRIPFNKAKTELKKFVKLGGQAVTLTGGGEPLAYPEINELIDFCDKLKLKIGLTTNFILWKKLKKANKLTWCRISISEENRLQDEWLELINNTPIDWAFSYVYTNNKKDLKEFLKKAIKLPVTHIRVVSDLYNLKHIPRVLKDDKIIYQDRTEYTKGARNCWASIIRPVLHADGYYYPCCGVQYARKGTKRDMIPEMRSTNDLEEFIKEQVPFDGSKCEKCYYDQYNKALELLNQKYKHIEFI